MRDDLAVVATAACLVAAWLAFIAPLLTTVQYAGEFTYHGMQPPKPDLYYLANGIAVVAALVAGALGVSSGGLRSIGLVGQIAMAVMLVSAIAWSVAAYSPAELLSGAVFGPTGPLVWLVTVFLFSGANERVWRVQGWIVQLLAYLTAALALRELAVSRFLPVQDHPRYAAYTLALIWLSGWLLLTGTSDRGWRFLLRFVPFAALLMSAICSLSRPWTIISLAIFGLFVYRRAKEQGDPSKATRVFLAAGVIAVVGVAAVYMLAPGAALQSVTRVAELVGSDAKLSHYPRFFESVPLSSFLLGAGPKATWHLVGVGDFQHFANGFLWTAFVGGLPILIAYYILVLRPALRLAGRGLHGEDYAVVVLVITWGVAMAGLSSYAVPGVSFVNLVILLWVGRCHVLHTAYAVAKAERRLAARYKA